MMEYETLKDELLAEIDTGLKFARSLDGDAEFEIYLLYRSRSSVSIKQGVVDATDGIVTGNAVRVAKQRRVNFASSSGISAVRIQRSIKEAVAGLNTVSVEDERFVGFCDPTQPGKEGTFVSDILNLSIEDLVDSTKHLVEDAKAIDKRILASATCTMKWGGFAIGNTLGVQQASRSALNSCVAFAMAIDGEERRTASEEEVTREHVFRIDELGERAARKALSLLGAKKLDKTTVLPTVWVPKAAAAYFLASLGMSANGRTVVEGLSPLADVVGDKIANPNLTLTDDGQNPSGIATEAIDAEGYPQGKTTIIDRGVLKHFLFDTYYSRIFGTESTGNCSRGGGIFGASLPYEQAPEISPTSLEVLPGSKSEEDLINSIVGQAILIAEIPIGIFHSDVSTGEFSVVAPSVFLIEDGEKKYPLQPVSVAGNFYQGLKQLREIGSNTEITPFGITVSSLLFDGFSIVG